MKLALTLLTLALAGCSNGCAYAKAKQEQQALKELQQALPQVLWRMPERPVCATGIEGPAVAARVGEPELVEVSGIAVSPSHPGVLWMHNDSGDSARVFAVSTSGAPLGELKLAIPDYDEIDLEEIQPGPCPDMQRACIYVADTGSNKDKRAELFVYAFVEPDVAVDKPLPEGAKAEVWTFPLAMPEENLNVEGFVVLPDASAMIFFEKRHDDARILRYSSPWTPNVRATLEETARMVPPGEPGRSRLITGANVHPSGTRLLLRTYVSAWEAKLPDDGRGFHQLEQEDFVELFVPPDEPQGEAIAYDESGTGLWTISESKDRMAGEALHHAACAK